MNGHEILENNYLDNIRVLLDNSSFKEKTLEYVLKNHQLSEEAVNEFRYCISAEMFSTSYKLDYELTKKFPELFDINLWINSKDKSETFINKEIIDMLRNNSLDDSIILDIDFSDLKYAKLLLAEYPEATKQDIMKHFIGELSEEALLKYSDILDLSTLFANKKYSFNIRKIISESPEFLDKYLNSLSEISPADYLSLIIATDKLGLIKTELSKNRSNISVYTGTNYSNELSFAMSRVPEDIIDLLFDFCKKYMPRQLNYTLLSHQLQTKDFSEGFLIKYLDLFKANGLALVVKKQANNFGYDKLLKLL